MSEPIEKFAKYSINPSVIPPHLLLPVSIEELIKSNVTSYNFELENKLLPTYEGYYEKALKLKEKQERENKAKENKSNEMDNDKVYKENIKEDKVKDMMKQSGQDRDVCYFYLESVDWDLEKAMELYKSSY